MKPDWEASARRIPGLPPVDYHAMRALSASGAWLLAEECAAKFLWRSPWNPLYAPEAKTEFDVGVAAHLAVLEPERQADSIVVIEAGDYRTTKAREARDAARAAGLVPLLPWQFDIVRAIAGSIRAHPIASEAFRGGEAEVTLIWPDPDTGIPCKARPDYLPVHGRWLVDLKTAASAIRGAGATKPTGLAITPAPPGISTAPKPCWGKCRRNTGSSSSRRSRPIW